MKTKPVPCLECGREFEAALKELKRGYGKFCTRGCSGKYNGRKQIKGKSHWPTHECATCKKSFKSRPGTVRGGKHGHTFCSRPCKDKAQRLNGIKDLHPSHYGDGKGGGGSRYRTKALRHHGPRCNRCGYDKYEKILDVHHKDRNRRNNRPENLEVLCRNCHDEEHLLAGDGKFTPMAVIQRRVNRARTLTDEQAKDIRERYASRKETGELLKDIAAEYGVSASAVTKIGKGKTYVLTKDTGL